MRLDQLWHDIRRNFYCVCWIFSRGIHSATEPHSSRWRSSDFDSGITKLCSGSSVTASLVWRASQILPCSHSWPEFIFKCSLLIKTRLLHTLYAYLLFLFSCSYCDFLFEFFIFFVFSAACSFFFSAHLTLPASRIVITTALVFEHVRPRGTIIHRTWQIC